MLSYFIYTVFIHYASSKKLAQKQLFNELRCALELQIAWRRMADSTMKTLEAVQMPLVVQGKRSTVLEALLRELQVL